MNLSTVANCRFLSPAVYTAAFLLMALVGGVCDAQSDDERASGGSIVDSAYLPPTSIATARIRPQLLLESEIFQWMPIEVAEAWTQEALGLDLRSVQDVRFVLNFPAGRGAPPMGFVIRLSQPFDPAGIDPELLAVEDPQMVGQRQVYALGDRQMPFLLHALDPQTILIASPAMLEPMILAEDATGELADLVATESSDQPAVEIGIGMLMLRPIAMQMAQQAGEDLPPPMRRLTEVPNYLDAIWVNVSANQATFHTELRLIASDDGAAEKLQDIVDEAIVNARDMFVQQMDAEVDDDGPIGQAQRAYARRLADGMLAMMQPQREGDRLLYEAESGVSVAAVGVLTGLLMPAVQAARNAARRVATANNLKQIGLAMHNYHSAYRKLPGPAIVDENGKPLLSWRVAVLPFVEQQALYEQFHLDEPWDSPHNIQLIDQMPDVYRDPEIETDPGETIYHAMVDDKALQKHGGPNRFRDCLDGLSNTIMAVQVTKENAVPWTAPIDFEIDWDDPLAGIKRMEPGGIQVLMADGAVLVFDESLGAETFKKMITRAGGEIIDAR
ncbi:hypothetical protein V7x_11430 [Crateriforma conspicua]|uniref:DUF1559 domain-containing protein n=1 Tax=Crateriforma conspicua TaxID=2527996 RepID=A0A5C6FVG0_9PLAN|nr:DUF1559 domain-containing protein [Crateriforma conspicua]TWU65595.1 hypothetical protein V7x_11430 [Crateriforma conspicua]